MSGAFQTSREIFDNPVWKNITEFRIFFLIYGSAIFAEEGYRVSDDLHLERGQWLRSTRKLQDDLMYIDNRQTKKYSTATINRCIKSLVSSQRLCTKTHELGTVFTVVNYESYQGFGSYKKDNLEHNLEHSRNSDETVTKQRRNNNNKDNKDKKVNKVLKDTPQFDEFWNMYPRRVGNVDALNAWNNAIKRGAIPEDIYKSVENYKINISFQGTETQFIKHPASFLNKDRWKEYLNQLTVLKGGQADASKPEQRRQPNANQYYANDPSRGTQSSVQSAASGGSRIKDPEYDLDNLFVRR